MTTIVTRSGKGSPLTHAEMDANLTNLNTNKIESADVRTLTNKSINLTNNTLTGTVAEFNTALSDGNFATQAGSETLTNKTVNLASNTLTGTTAEFNTALSDANFVTQAGAETVTNKTIGSGTTISADVANTATGSFQIATGTTAQRPTGANGKVRFNSTLNIYEGYNESSATWAPLGGGATGAAGNPVFHENDITVTGDYTITTNKNAVSAGPITINTGVTVTVPTGSTWTVV